MCDSISHFPSYYCSLRRAWEGKSFPQKESSKRESVGQRVRVRVSTEVLIDLPFNTGQSPYYILSKGDMTDEVKKRQQKPPESLSLSSTFSLAQYFNATEPRHPRDDPAAVSHSILTLQHASHRHGESKPIVRYKSSRERD